MQHSYKESLKLYGPAERLKGGIHELLFKSFTHETQTVSIIKHVRKFKAYQRNRFILGQK